MRGLRAMGAALIAALAVAPAALAHGDPASHYLETDALYPSFARNRQCSPAGAARPARRGRPGAATRSRSRSWPAPRTWSTTSGCSRRRSAMRTAVAALIERRLAAPVLIVTPYGAGVAGRASVDGRLRPVAGADAGSLLRGVRIPATGERRPARRHGDGGRPPDRPGRRSRAPGRRAAGEAVHPSAGRGARAPPTRSTARPGGGYGLGHGGAGHPRRAGVHGRGSGATCDARTRFDSGGGPDRW